MRTHRFSDTLDYDLVSLLNSIEAAPLRNAQKAMSPASALSFPVTISDNKGFEGVIIRLRYGAAVATPLNLRRPGGTLITPLTADGINVAYAENPEGRQTVYLLRSAENGIWHVEFEDAGLGAWNVEVLAPRGGPSLSISAPSGDLMIQPTDTVTVMYSATNFNTVGTVNVYLDSDRTPGGGILAATGPVMNQSSFVLSVSNVPPGVYYIGAVANPEGQIPVTAYASGKLIISGSQVSPGELYVTKSSFRIDWRRHGQGVSADTLQAAGFINPAGLPTSLAGVTVRAKVNGINLGAMTLAGNGRFSSPGGSQPRFRFSLNARNGAFLFFGSALDLREILGITGADAAGTTIVELALEVGNSTAEVPIAKATIEYDYRPSVDSSSKGSFLFQKQRTLTGSFISLRTSAVQQGQSEFSLSASGRLLGPGNSPIIPTNDVTITIGGTNVVVPITAFVTSGETDSTSTWKYSQPRGSAVPGLQQFTINNATRSFSVKVVGLNGTGIPAVGNGTSYALPLSFTVPTATGSKRFETVVELKRPNTRSVRWSR